MPSHYPPHWKKKTRSIQKIAQLDSNWHDITAQHVGGSPRFSCYWNVQQTVHPGASTERYMARTVPVALKLQCLRPKNGDQCWKRCLFDWKAPGRQCALNFPVQVVTTWTGESCMAKAKQILSRKCLKIVHVAAAHPERHLRPWKLCSR